MRKIGIVLASLAMVLGFGVTPANAVSNGLHHEQWNCTTSGTGGVAFSAEMTYSVSGLGSSATNVVNYLEMRYSTSPAAQLNALQIALRSSASQAWPGPTRITIGGSTTTLNDVPSSDVVAINNGAFSFDEGYQPTHTMKVFGGVGDSQGSCTDTGNV